MGIDYDFFWIGELKMTDEEMKKIIEAAGYTVLKTEEDKFLLETPNNRNSDWEMLHGEEYTLLLFISVFSLKRSL